MKLLVLSLSVCLAGASCAAANDAARGAASVAELSGNILINKGKGFAPAHKNATLKAGDRVLVKAKSSTTLVFGNCKVTLSTPMVFVVKRETPCNTVVARTRTAGLGGAAAGGLATAGTPLLFVAPLAVACAVKCSDVLGDENTPVSAP